LILGAGPIGALLQSLLSLKGLTDVTIYDVSEYRCQVLDKVFPGSVKEPKEPYDLVFETTGSSAVAKDLLPKVIGKSGLLVMIGLFRNATQFNFNHLVENEWKVSGSSAFSSELPDAVLLLEDHWTEFRHIISHCLSLSEYQTAFDLVLDSRKRALKVIFNQDLDSGSS